MLEIFEGLGNGIDNIFVMKEASFGFLTESKESPYPWLMAACAVAPGAMPLCLTFFAFGWIECSRAAVQCLGG